MQMEFLSINTEHKRTTDLSKLDIVFIYVQA